jgi:hypothetical protein
VASFKSNPSSDGICFDMLKWCCSEQWSWFILALLGLQQSLQHIKKQALDTDSCFGGKLTPRPMREGTSSTGNGNCTLKGHQPMTPDTCYCRWSHGFRTIGLSFLRSKADETHRSRLLNPLNSILMEGLSSNYGYGMLPERSDGWSQINSPLGLQHWLGHFGSGRIRQATMKVQNCYERAECWDDRLPWVSSFTCWILSVGLAMGERDNCVVTASIFG